MLKSALHTLNDPIVVVVVVVYPCAENILSWSVALSVEDGRAECERQTWDATVSDGVQPAAGGGAVGSTDFQVMAHQQLGCSCMLCLRYRLPSHQDQSPQRRMHNQTYCTYRPLPFLSTCRHLTLSSHPSVAPGRPLLPQLMCQSWPTHVKYVGSVNYVGSQCFKPVRYASYAVLNMLGQWQNS